MNKIAFTAQGIWKRFAVHASLSVPPSGSSHSFNHDFQGTFRSEDTIRLISRKQNELFDTSIVAISPRVIESVLAGSVILSLEMDELLKSYKMEPSKHF